jgi:DNA-binding transcriptional MerR regulator
MRLKFLKLEAKGFSLSEIVKLLSEKYQTSERNIYYDAKTRDTWQPVLTQLFDLDKARLIVISRYDFH